MTVQDRWVAWLTPRRVRLYAAALALAVWSAWAASQLTGPGLLDSNGKIVGTDFLSFYTAGHFLVSGDGALLYDFSAQTAFQDGLGARAQQRILFPFVNPPFAALLYAPYAFFAYFPALVLWWLTGLACLTAALALMRRELGAAGHRLARWLAVALAFFPTILWAMHGQNSPVSLLLTTGAFVALRRRKDGVAGILMGCQAYKPQLAIAPVVALVAARRWRALVAGAAAALGWVAAGTLLFPEATSAYRAFAPQLPNLLRQSPKAWGIHSFFGASFLALDSWWPFGATGVTAILTVAALFGLGYVWVRLGWRPGTRAWDLAMAGTFAMALLVSPHLFTYDLTLLLLPLAIVWAHTRRAGGARDLDGGRVLAATAALYVLLVASSYLAQGQQLLTAYLGLPVTALQVSTVALAAWSVMLLRMAMAAAQALTLDEARAQDG